MTGRKSFLNGARSAKAAGRASFTVVEMLVAITVFLMLLVFFSAITIMASNTALRDNAKMDSLGDVRQALDRFALDWSARVRRSDVTMSATTNSISFLTQVRSYNGTRQLASVFYQVNTNSYALQRGILGYNWGFSTDPTPDNNPSMLFATASGAATNLNSPTSASPASPAASDYETTSADVFRMTISFLWTNGFSTNTALIYSTNLQGIVVTVAALDQQNRKILTSAQLAALAVGLDSGLTNNVSPLAVWQDSISNTNYATTANVPVKAAAAVRVFQRIFYTKE